MCIYQLWIFSLNLSNWKSKKMSKKLPPKKITLKITQKVHERPQQFKITMTSHSKSFKSKDPFSGYYNSACSARGQRAEKLPNGWRGCQKSVKNCRCHLWMVLTWARVIAEMRFLTKLLLQTFLGFKIRLKNDAKFVLFRFCYLHQKCEK